MTSFTHHEAGTPALNLRGDSSGFAIDWMGEPVAVFPDFDGASAGFKAAKSALAELERVLSTPRQA